jgi:hypothetical protein
MKLPYVRLRRASVLAPILVSITLAVLLSGCLTSGSAATTGPLVSVFPIPNDQVASPHSQLVFRGLPASEIGTLAVSGSRSGTHAGTIEADSDGDGGSFLPSRAFTPGETVTVRTSLNIRGVSSGTYRFSVAQPLPPVPLAAPQFAGRVRGDAQRFHSRPDLHPVAVKITKDTSRAAPGYIFLAPQSGPVQDGPMIIDSEGHLVWFKPVPRNDVVTDFRVQTYNGQPVLTWWQGSWNASVGRGEDVIANAAYQNVKYVRAANGMDADLHEFQITRNGEDALITAYYPVWWNATSVGGKSRAIVFDSVVQEVDIATGLVLFQWDSLDHIPLKASYGRPPPNRGHPYNYFHINSVAQDYDGDLILSARNTWAAYKININTGQVIWTLGGKHSSFRSGRGAGFAFQHDARVRANGDRVVTLFDDGAGPPSVHSSSRGLELRLNFKTRTATEAVQDLHSPKLLADYEGNDQQLPNGDDFIGWGQQPYFSEYNARGQLVFDGHLVGANPMYRAYRFSWTGAPAATPALAVTLSKGIETAYVSWNGATGVRSWRVLAGGSTDTLKPVLTARWQGFETAIRIPSETYVEVEALGAQGQVMATSAAERPQ